MKSLHSLMILQESIVDLSDPTLRVLVDGRWEGAHGIGRFALEVIPRIQRSGTTLEKLGSFPLLHPLDPLWISWKIARHNPDVYFSPGFNPPLWNTAPFVFTVYDLIHLRFAKDYSWKQRAYYRAVVRSALERASVVLTVSEFSKKEILNWGAVPETKVRVVGAGVGDEFNPEVDPLPLSHPYFLYVGNRKSHKNITRSLEAFAKAKFDPEVRFVLSGEADRETAELVRSLRLSERVLFFGTASNEALPRLYRGAIALVFPSLFEGFGLPPLEAMACGTPVITSNTSSIPEVVGDAGIMLNPYAVDAWADEMERVLSDDRLRASMSARGLERAKLFSWDNSAQLVYKYLVEAAESA
jgi:glycosyltransferase involved in cell wall biosynthesis